MKNFTTKAKEMAQAIKDSDIGISKNQIIRTFNRMFEEEMTEGSYSRRLFNRLKKIRSEYTNEYNSDNRAGDGAQSRQVEGYCRPKNRGFI